MIGYRLTLVLLCVGVLGPQPGCKKKKAPPPKELASLEPRQACKHFFGRVKRCADTINELQADRLKLEGAQRRGFLQQVGMRLKRSFSDLDRLCERYAQKSRKQQHDMDRCYRERTCDGFARCFVQMADAEVKGMGANPLQDLRKQLEQLKQGRRPQQGHGHMHSHGPQPRPRPRPQPRP